MFLFVDLNGQFLFTEILIETTHPDSFEIHNTLESINRKDNSWSVSWKDGDPSLTKGQNSTMLTFQNFSLIFIRVLLLNFIFDTKLFYTQFNH